jgi:hypothetical protein
MGALLFALTVLNYVDRQPPSLLSPYLKQLYTEQIRTTRNLLIGFLIA